MLGLEHAIPLVYMIYKPLCSFDLVFALGYICELHDFMVCTSHVGFMIYVRQGSTIII